jgi:hypothetical protein
MNHLGAVATVKPKTNPCEDDTCVIACEKNVMISKQYFFLINFILLIIFHAILEYSLSWRSVNWYVDFFPPYLEFYTQKPLISVVPETKGSIVTLCSRKYFFSKEKVHFLYIFHPIS